MKLDVGSGRDSFGDYKTVDNDPSVGADYLADIEEVLPFADSSISEIRAHSILEHIDTRNKVKVMAEFWRILEVGGILDIKVPIAGSPQSFQDPTHLSFWNARSFWYFIEDHPLHRAFRARYSKYPVPGFRLIKAKTERYVHYIKLQKGEANEN